MSVDFLSLNAALAEVYAFLAPSEQHELRTTCVDAARWYDNAAENGAVPFYAAVEGQKWKSSPVHPRTSETPAAVTANVRNYYFSTLNTYSQTNEAISVPTLDVNDEYESTDVKVHSFILQGLKCKKVFVTGLNGIKTIDKRFLEKCTAEEIVFDGANQLESVTMHWMLRCPNLKKVEFKGPMPKLASVSNCFMAECPNLETVDFTGLTGLKRVDDRWFFNSPNLTNVDFAPMAGTLSYVGCCFLGHVTKVANLETKLGVLTSLKEVNTIGQYAPPALRAFAKDKPVKSQ